VRRFAVSQPHDTNAFRLFSDRVLAGPRARADELEWVRRAGPWSPGLLDFLKRQHRSYDALVFFSLWNPLTVHGLQIAPERSVLFPHLQLQPALRFGLFREVLSSARALGFLSAAEPRLLRDYVRLTPEHAELVGIGIDPSPEQAYPRHQQNPADTVVAEDEVAVEDTGDGMRIVLVGRGESPGQRRHADN